MPNRLLCALAGMKTTHWLTWLVLFGCIAFLSLIIFRHPTDEVTRLAESFRPDYGLLPVHIILHRGLARMAGYALAVVIILTLIAITKPHVARIVVPLAIGLSVLFFAYHTFFYARFMTDWMRYMVQHPPLLYEAH
ncbi:hypothetical protein BH11VER1_BH11VER1_05830 [soil metagenome]